MKKIVLLLALVTIYCQCNAQVGINSDNSTPDPSSMLDIKSTNKGVLLPRLTHVQIAAISNPVNGLMVFCTTDSKLYIYLNTLNQWKEIPLGAGTILPFECGDSITIHHISGEVAPVNKIVTYGTVNNIWGENDKCWISQNLGADHQATAVNDTNEASAGWYWQFNRKQGYTNDGTTTTPAWTITSINENSDWTTDNDPCNLELGGDWRIPTRTEWWNVSALGGWTNWYGSWVSGLNLHAAGHLMTFGGFLFLRGDEGNYWSSTEYDPSQGWVLTFFSPGCYLNDTHKAKGFSIRCIRE